MDDPEDGGGGQQTITDSMRKSYQSTYVSRTVGLYSMSFLMVGGFCEMLAFVTRIALLLS